MEFTENGDQPFVSALRSLHISPGFLSGLDDLEGLVVPCNNREWVIHYIFITSNAELSKFHHGMLTHHLSGTQVPQWAVVHYWPWAHLLWTNITTINLPQTGIGDNESSSFLGTCLWQAWRMSWMSPMSFSLFSNTPRLTCNMTELTAPNEHTKTQTATAEKSLLR